jgi:predicted enzyme related to lactoylglutathione lyase
MTATATRPEVHLSIDVPDLAAGLAFYRAVCGFAETARPFPTMAVLDAGAVTVCLHEKAAGSPSSPGGPPRRYDRHWTPVHLDLHVGDFDATLARIAAAGGMVEQIFRDRGPRLAAFCCDPFGNGFCVIGPKRPGA